MVEGYKSVNMNLVLHVVAGLSVKFHCECKPLLFCTIGEMVTSNKKMPKIDTLDALDDEMTSILNTL